MCSSSSRANASGLKSQVNGVLAIIQSELDAKGGRHTVQLMDETTHSINTTNMTPYIKHAAAKGKNYTVKDIVNHGTAAAASFPHGAHSST